MTTIIKDSKFSHDLLNIESFKSDIQYSNGKAEFNQIKFLTNESTILGDIIVSIKNIDSDGLNGTTLDGHLNEINYQTMKCQNYLISL